MRLLIQTSATRVMLLAVSYLTVLVTARAYGPEGSGQFAAAPATMTVAATFASMSLGRVLALLISRSSEAPREFLGRHFVSLLAMLGALLGLASVIMIAAFFLKPSLFGTVSPLLLLIAGGNLAYFVWQTNSMFVFSCLGELAAQNRIIATSRVVFLGALAVAVLLKATLPVFLLFVTMGNVTNLVQRSATSGGESRPVASGAEDSRWPHCEAEHSYTGTRSGAS